MPEPALQTRSEGAFLGAAVGDALGWPVEDRSGRIGGRRGLVPAFEFIEWRRREGGRYQPHEEEIAAGSYSDDTQLTLAVARSLLRGSGWWSWLTHHELPFWLLYERGGGGATKRSASSWSRGKPPWRDKDAAKYFAAGGNGVAMRAVAHSVAHGAAPFSETAAAVIADGITTHGHPRALVGALLQSYAVARALTGTGVLGYGELIDAVIESDEWHEFVTPDAHVDDWEDAASASFGRPYRDVWNETVVEVRELLGECRKGIERGSLAVDRSVLERIGSFGSSGGAGTVTAAGAIFLASRYASQPQGGVVAAAFAKGGDTDTLAAMTGAILGAVHGADWLDVVAKHLEDANYIRTVARRLASGERNGDAVDTSERPVAARNFWRSFGEPKNGAAIELPDGRKATVATVVGHEPKREGLLAKTWVVATEDGQTLHVKHVQTKKAPTRRDTAAAPPDAPNVDEEHRRPRIGVVLQVDDLERARAFYRDVVGLQVTKDTDNHTVFAGLLALERVPDPLNASEPNQQLALDGIAPAAVRPPSFDTRCALTIYLLADDFERAREGIEKAGRPVSPLATSHGRATFRCLDPDGNVVEFRSRNGG